MPVILLRVQDPTTLSDFAGNDVAAPAGAVGGGGAGAIVMENQNGAR